MSELCDGCVNDAEAEGMGEYPGYKRHTCGQDEILAAERPKLVREWVGMLCRLTRPIHNGYGEAEKGTLMVVSTTHRGKVNIKKPAACECCGIRWSCGAVHLRDLQPVRRIGPPQEARPR